MRPRDELSEIKLNEPREGRSSRGVDYRWQPSEEIKSQRSFMFLHGIGNGPAIFDRILPRMMHLGTSYALPLPAAGSGRALPELVDDLHGLAAELARPPWTLVGHSMGGLAAGLLTARHSNDVDHLVLLNSPLPTVLERLSAGTTRPLDRLGRALTSIKTLSAIQARFDVQLVSPLIPPGIRWVETGITRELLRPFFSDVSVLTETDIRELFLSANFSEGDTHLKLVSAFRIADMVPNDDIPVSIILGQSDPLIPESDIEKITGLFPRSTITQVATGHFAHIEDPTTVVEVISRR